MQYLNYSAADLARDTYFQRWVLDQEHSVGSFWTNWLLEHPEKEPVVQEAIRIMSYWNLIRILSETNSL